MKLLSKKEVGQRRVYDIEVEDVHNFYANGVNVHNCATDGGVSVIKDDGTVVDITFNRPASGVVEFNDTHLLSSSGNSANKGVEVAIPLSDLTSDLSVYYFTYAIASRLGQNTIGDKAIYLNNGDGIDKSVLTPNGFAANAGNGALGRTLMDFDAPANGMVAYTTSTYNTGWMPGDIKGAFLADTDDTDLVGDGTLEDNDRSVNNNGLIVNGTVTREPVAPGADLVAYTGFSSTNYLEQPYNPDLDFGTGDFCVMGWVKDTENSATDFYIQREVDALGNGGFALLGVVDEYRFTCGATDILGGTRGNGAWDFLVGLRRGSNVFLYVNGDLVASGTSTTDLTDSSAILSVGQASGGGFQPSSASLALLRISATAPTPEQIAKIYEDEKVLFQENAQATLYGTSDAVTALAHDEVTDLLHVGSSDGRSVFQGLRRVSNTTTPVNTAISAVGGMIAED